MYDLAKLKNARFYMLAMAEGVNPCTREFAPETDVIAIPSVQEQCEYVMGVLDELIEIATEMDTKKKRSRAKRRNKAKRQKIELPSNIIELSDSYIGPCELADRINAVLGANTRRLHGVSINNFMVDEGYLDRVVVNGRIRKKLNDRSASIGLSSRRKSENARERILYSKQAQEFVVKNLGKILKHRQKSDWR